MNFLKKLFPKIFGEAPLPKLDDPETPKITFSEKEIAEVIPTHPVEIMSQPPSDGQKPARKIPADISEKIEELFSEAGEQEAVRQIIGSFWTQNLNVAAAQLARAVLVLSNGKLTEVEGISADFWGDPRDVLMSAETKMGNPGHYCKPSFRETKAYQKAWGK